MAEGEKINVTEDISAEDTAGQETGHMKGAIAGMCSKHHGDRGKSRVQVGRADTLIAAATPELGLAGPEAGGRHRRNRTAFQAKKTAGKRYQRGAQPMWTHVGTTPSRDFHVTHTFPGPGSLGSSHPWSRPLCLSGHIPIPSHLVLLGTQSNPVKTEMDGETPP